MSITSTYEKLKRELKEQGELDRAKAVVKAREKLARSQEREKEAREKAERERQLTAEKEKEREAKERLREASLARSQASAALRHERWEGVKAYPLFKPVEFSGRALKRMARPEITKFYVLGVRPQNSPSWEALSRSFENQPFTAEQAVQVVSNARQTSEADAWNRLRLMKSRGYIKEGV